LAVHQLACVVVIAVTVLVWPVDVAGTAAFALVDASDEDVVELALALDDFAAFVALVTPVDDVCAAPFAAASSANADVPVTTPPTASARVMRRARSRARARCSALWRGVVAMTTTMSAAGKARIA
jgi:hypothetical protein